MIALGRITSDYFNIFNILMEKNKMKIIYNNIDI